MQTSFLGWIQAGAAAALLAVAPVHASETTATSGEIDGLFTALLQSGCEFSRNGSWYSAKEASEHLRGKYDYLRQRNLVPSAEAFIERAASKSSLSGKPYQVRCPGQPVVDSGPWFTQRLQGLRAPKPAP